jgi:hypothetical protein
VSVDVLELWRRRVARAIWLDADLSGHARSARHRADIRIGLRSVLRGRPRSFLGALVRLDSLERAASKADGRTSLGRSFIGVRLARKWLITEREQAGQDA